MTAKKVFVDTSAFLAVLDASDRCHAQAASIWKELIRTGTILVISSYVLVESCAVIQRRLGMEALRLFCTNVYPGLKVFWVEPDLHAAGVDAVLAAGRRRLSLVDCVSFAVMRRSGINTAFTFDPHFAEQGFEILGNSELR